MIKKGLSTIFAMLLVLLACTSSGQSPRDILSVQTVFHDETAYTVPSPMPYPDYTFDHTPSVNELRETVVRAAHDLLSIQWSTSQNIYYHKSGPVNQKRFQHQANTTYAGTPYSNGSTGIFQFFEYYDSKTGRLWYPGSGEELSRNLGNSCADSMIWGYNTVCSSIQGAYYPSTMVYANGYYPVGNYTYDFTINTYNKLPTGKIIEQNGMDTIMEAYSHVLPGDCMVSTPDNHAMMAIEKAHTIYNADGTLNTTESYIMIQDQRGGPGAGFYEQVENGQLIQYSGRTSAKYFFDDLYRKQYLPVAPAELLGTREYEKALVSATFEHCTSVDTLRHTRITSNYPIAVINMIVIDNNAAESIVERVIFGGSKENGPPREYTLSSLSSLEKYVCNKYIKDGYTIKIEVVVSTGERFIPVTANF